MVVECMLSTYQDFFPSLRHCRVAHGVTVSNNQVNRVLRPSFPLQYYLQSNYDIKILFACTRYVYILVYVYTVIYNCNDYWPYE